MEYNGTILYDYHEHIDHTYINYIMNNKSGTYYTMNNKSYINI